MEGEIRRVFDELKTIKVDIEFIKEHMVDADTILTSEEEDKLDESISEFRKGKTVSLGEFRRED